ncbi:hypothetical protein AA23498_1675 [Acetobacter nitrogenifigens DSM 23921 = NBRC 105050]|uniref:Uncharacterized protein n=1 Tax=Acetobacter nitrogenifigens DSM 23921 = NBRC 105050 TaxID=1120919 RepID=A0A511X984_9PROT|nr:hypothetical protein [Acetobacter nitrogenifigens]GBQ93257.1 hypothetical protein AA23498_1675 [Acetobacter nitrogenifigens DSM 23921 = NBRC 105050]GEN59513.1 hypothetical protein ANI02nite_13970 [Acetobacter nitrogenifigens DSM 23921 = NBRC 105050]
MTFGERVSKADLWLLDKVFQPVANRMPEKLSAVELGMSMLFGALMLSAASIVAMVFLTGMEITDAIFNVLIWAFGLSFYIGVARMKTLVRPGHLNPLRVMLTGMRLLSIPFAIYAFYQGVSAPAPFVIPLWFNALANLVFVVGIYFVSCEPPPPPMRQSVWERGFGEASNRT